MIKVHASIRVMLATLPALLPWASSVFAQSVDVDSTSAVEPVGRAPQVEPHVAVSPLDPDRLIAAAMTFPPDVDGAYIVAWYSEDGGATWHAGDLRFRGDDPWVAFAPDGTAYVSALGVVHRSDDGGRTWSDATLLSAAGGAFDYSKMVVTHDGAVQIWTLWSRSEADLPTLLTSRDRARSFGAPDPAIASTLDHQVGGIDLAADGTLLASYHEFSSAGELLESPRLWLIRSTDAGRTWDAPFLVREAFLADSPELVADPTRAGHVLLGWSEINRERTQWRVVVTRSTDGGRTWNEPVVLDEGELPNGAYMPHHPALAVAPDGIVGVTWRDPAFDRGERCFSVSFAPSLDGGASFAASTALAGVTCADVPGNRVPMRAEAPDRTVMRRFGDGGDYHGLVATAAGTFRALWADTRAGVYRLQTTRIRVRMTR